ncbi:MAG: hypothetical protein WCJ30_12300 [Deltaproteobacteria bacterium]
MHWSGLVGAVLVRQHRRPLVQSTVDLHVAPTLPVPWVTAHTPAEQPQPTDPMSVHNVGHRSGHTGSGGSTHVIALTLHAQLQM